MEEFQTSRPLALYPIPPECAIPDCDDDPEAALAVWPWPAQGEVPIAAFLCQQHADLLTMAGLRPDVVEHSCGSATEGRLCGAVATHVAVAERGRHLTVLALCPKHLPDPIV